MFSSSLEWKSGPSISASSLFGLCCSRGCCLTIIVNTGRNKPPAETRTSVFTEKLLFSFPLWVLLRPSSFYSVFDAVKILGVTKTHTHKKQWCSWNGQNRINLQHVVENNCTQTESVTVLCREKSHHLGWEWKVQAAPSAGLKPGDWSGVTNSGCSSRSHQSHRPIEAHILTERAPIRPGVLLHRMKDDYSVLCCIYSCSARPPRNLRPARKIWPHSFNALWILRLHKCFLILAIIYYF